MVKDMNYYLNKELMKLKKREIMTFFMEEIRKYKCELTKKRGQVVRMQLHIRHYKVRLLKIRNSIDYLLEHPYSVDTSFQTKKHPRDNTMRLSQSKIPLKLTSK